MSEIKLTSATLVELLRRGLAYGVPPTALSNMFDLELEVVENLQSVVRREEYGAAELSEVLSNLTWQSIRVTMNILQSGSNEMKMKAAQNILSKALATSVRQTPEEIKKARNELLAWASQERIVEIEGEVVEASAFVASDATAHDQG